MSGIEYEIRESVRAKNLRLTVEPDGRVVVTKPKRVSLREVERWMATKSEWIEKARAYFEKRNKGVAPEPLPKPRRGSKAYKDAVEAARVLVTERLPHFNTAYGFSYGRISIRNQKTRWGSCSMENNLSFNYRIAFLPHELADYIIVHELCHTKEHNHSARFWDLVARTVPKHKEARRIIRTRYST
ncbi:MAG: putative metal-dependent hydrolase [Parcubacteria bacterium C7867-004]|nr:MAG: putative metal-dependent hydrolase [Parcubacteria bacterium C7867-004]